MVMGYLSAVLYFLVIVSHVTGKAGVVKDSDVWAYVDSSIHLGASNWTAALSTGVWFIEFYTPFSASCKAFAPTWQELSLNKKALRTSYPSTPFSIAQVDCSVERDLCVEEEVRHVPRLTLYRDGVLKESEYTGEREYTALSAYIDEEAQAYRTAKASKAEQGKDVKPDIVEPIPAPAPAPADAPSKKLQDNSDKDAADIVPPPPQQAPDRTKDDKKDDTKGSDKETPAGDGKDAAQNEDTSTKPNPNGKVLQYGLDDLLLDEAALQRFLSRDAGVGASFVKFFAPWCPHCRAMAGAYTRVGEALRDQINVIEVNCEAHHATCVKYNIKSFPTLRMYNEGEMVEFRGSRSFDAMKTWALKVGGASGMLKIEAKQLEQIARDNDVFFLYLHGATTPDHEITSVIVAARTLLTKTAHAFRSSSPELILRYSRFLHGLHGSPAASSGLLVFKDHDLNEPYAFFEAPKSDTQAETSVRISSWLDIEHYPALIELTGTTFNEVLRHSHGARVLLAALSDEHHSGSRLAIGSGAVLRERELESFRAFVSQWRKRSAQRGQKDPHRVLFAWIDADRWATVVRKCEWLCGGHE